MKVERWTRTSRVFTGGLAVSVVILAAVPLIFDPDVVQKLTTLLILVLLAAMWNALAGYGGLLSVGQQAFIGMGAYATVFFANLGVPPYAAMLVATVVAGAISVPISLFALRLRAAQFAIGMWVIAEVASIVVRLDQNLGAGTGISLIQLNQYEPNFRQAYTFWLALGFAVIFLAALFLLLRSPLGVSLQAIRDDEDAARSIGVRVASRKRLLFVLAAFGCSAAGVLVVANTLFIEPGSVFSVQWSAYMIFMVLVGGSDPGRDPAFRDPGHFHSRRAVVPRRSRGDRGLLRAGPAPRVVGDRRGAPGPAVDAGGIPGGGGEA